MIDLDCNDDIVDRWIQVKNEFSIVQNKHSARNDVVDVDDDVRSTWRTCYNYPEPPCESSPEKLVDQIGEREKSVDQIR